MSGRNFGQYLIRLLGAYGITHVFGIPGVHNAELYRGLSDDWANPGRRISHFTPRHEQGAGFMADGFARVAGRPAACFVITGPGLTNIATAMGQAYGDSIPMLVISTVQPPGRIHSGYGYLHELTDQFSVGRQLAAFSHTLTTIDEAATVIARAFQVFRAGRPRPVHIDIPTSLLHVDASHLPEPRVLTSFAPPAPDEASLAAAIRMIDECQRPLILAGGGAIRASAELIALAERIDAPVCLTINARGLLPPEHPLGVSYSASLPAIRTLIHEADCIIAVGTEIGPTDYDAYDDGGFSLPAAARLIRIEIDPEQAVRNALPDVALISDAGAALARLGQGVAQKDVGAASARVLAARQAGAENLSPRYRGLIQILEAIRAALPEAIIVGDSTQLTYAGSMGFAAATPGSWFNSSTGYGTLGYALPAATGAGLGALARGGARPVIALVGDGGMQFSLSELGAAKDAGVPVIVLLWNNHGYGEIKAFMLDRAIQPVGVDLFTPEFALLASAYGWHYTETRTLSGLVEELVASARRSDRPSMVEVKEAGFSLTE